MKSLNHIAKNKSLLLGLVLILSLVVMTACSNDEDQSTSPSITESASEEKSSGTNEEKSGDTNEGNSESNDTTTTDSDDNQVAESYYFDDLELIRLNGESARLYDYEGEIILLNFWATWCKYCDEEMPLLNEINKRDGITVIAIDVAEDAQTVNAYLEKFGDDFNLDVYLDEDSSLASLFGISGYPTTFFLGPDFEYYYSYPGMLTEEYLDQILDAIDAYQSEK